MADWSREQQRRVLAWFAEREKAELYLAVPVSGPGWRGWPANTGIHRFDAIGMKAGRGQLLDWDEQTFESRVAEPLQPVVAWGAADRPRLGQLIVGTALLSRSFPNHGPIHPVALVTPNQAEPNTAPAYFSRGYEIVAVPESVYE